MCLCNCLHSHQCNRWSSHWHNSFYTRIGNLSDNYLYNHYHNQYCMSLYRKKHTILRNRQCKKMYKMLNRFLCRSFDILFYILFYTHPCMTHYNYQNMFFGIHQNNCPCIVLCKFPDIDSCKYLCNRLNILLYTNRCTNCLGQISL